MCMTSEMPIKIGKVKTIAKIGGYTGRTETADPIDDIVHGYMIWLDAATSRKVGKVGKLVTVQIGRAKIKGKIIGGPGRTRYGDFPGRLKKVLLTKRVGEVLTKQEIRRLHERAVKMKGV